MLRAIESRQSRDERMKPAVRAVRDGALERWEAQPWRRQLQDAEAYERRAARATWVEALLAEGCAVEADVARFAGALEDRGALCIAQVVRFADGLRVRLARARTDDEVLQLTYLRRDAEELAERMIDWANTGRMPA